MRKLILILTTVVATLILTGCASKYTNQTIAEEDKSFTFESIKGSETLFNASFTQDGKQINPYFVASNTMREIEQQAKKRGYKYFQIVAPKKISNLNGFPITNAKDLASYINPQLTMPTEELGFFEGAKTLMDNNESQNIVDVPFTIFQDTTFDLTIRLIKEPTIEEIVWIVK